MNDSIVKVIIKLFMNEWSVKKMKCIDFRCRPPYKTFANEWFFGKNMLQATEASCGRKMADSAWNRSMELFYRELDAAEVDKAVVAGRYSFPGIPVEDLTISNDVVTELINQAPDRLVGVISADVRNCEKTFEELDHYVNHGACAGLTIEAENGNKILPFDDKSLYPIYDKCQRDDIFILFCTGFVYPNLAVSTPQAIDRVAQDFPNLRIMVSHGGWPWVTESCYVAFKRPNVYLSPDSFMLNRPGAEEYCNAANYLLSDKMCFGTAYPFLSFQDALEHAAKTIRVEVLGRYLYGNAERFLKL